VADPSTADSPTITDAAEARRYELTLDGQLAGFMDYRDAGTRRRILLHTEVIPAFEGRGLGGRLARHALEDARAAGRRVTVKCPFVQSWLERHHEYDDIVTGHGGRPTT
jgi:predicted GNAT family acetyltransferase